MSDSRARGAAVAEYEALTESVALVDDSDRVIVEVTGDRARDMINGLVTNALEPIARGGCVYAFMLTAKGRPVAEMRITPALAPSGGVDGAEPWTGDVWLDVPAACADSLLAHLAKYLPPLYARFRSTNLARLGVVGPLACRALGGASESAGWRIEGPPSEEFADLQAARIDTSASGSGASTGAALMLVRREPLEGPGFDLYTPASETPVVRSALEDAVRTLGGAHASRAAWETLRVERGVPVYGREITADNLPQETGQTERAIHFDKGCYTGQEVVARIHYRGHVNRRLAGFASREPTAPLPADAPLFLGDRKLAETRTAVVSPRFGAIALGYAGREVEPGRMLSREPGAPADVEVCPLPFTLT